MRLEKKVCLTCPRRQGGGVKAVQQKSKVKLLFIPCGFPNVRFYNLSDFQDSELWLNEENHVDVFLVLMVAAVAFHLCMDVVEVMVVWMAAFLNKR